MLPKQKQSKGRTRRRRSHHARVVTNYAECPKCNNPKLPHAACGNCGYVRPGLSIQLEKET